MQVGSIVFQGERGNWSSEIVKRVTKSKWSHMFITLGRFYDREVILESSGNSTSISFLDSYLIPSSYFVVYQPMRVQEEINHAIHETLGCYLGVEYGKLQAIGIGIASILNNYNIPYKNPFGYGSVCSELIYDYIDHLEYEFLVTIDQDTVSPEKLFRFVSRHSEFVQVGEKRVDQEYASQ